METVSKRSNLKLFSPEVSIDTALNFFHLEANQLSVVPFLKNRSTHPRYALLGLVTLVSSLTRAKQGTIQ
jgi:hypothetical protein